MKVQAKIYRGIEFVSVGDLPAGQQLLLQHNREPERINILVDGNLLKNCIQYSEYDRWYTSVYKRSVASVIKDPKPVTKEALQLNVSLQNS